MPEPDVVSGRPSTPPRPSPRAGRRAGNGAVEPPPRPPPPPPPRRPELARSAGRRASARAGPASSSSSARSRRPDLVSRQTVRHGVGRPRHLYDVTPDAQDLFPAELRRRSPPACSPRSRRSAATTSSRRSSTRGGASSATGSASELAERLAGRRAARRSGPRAGRHPGRAGLPRRARSLGADGTIRLARAQLRDLPRRRGLAGRLRGRARAVPRGPRRRRRPRDAHRLGRPLLHVPDQRQRAGGLSASDRTRRGP